MRAFIHHGCHSFAVTPGSAAVCLALAVSLACALPALAQGDAQSNPADLADLSIEELATIQVMSVSKRHERLQDAAAVFVITADDIRRSGADSLPEALRLAPNLHIARINGYAYSISARGMNSGASVLSNKLLEDVARIEVVSGPGGVMWGANYRNTVDRVSNSQWVAVLPARTTQRWGSVFLQDEIAPHDDWRLTLGRRAEYNPCTGLEWLLRCRWPASPPTRCNSPASSPASGPSLPAAPPACQ